MLARSTGGVPRLLNQAARQALVLADAADSSYVDVEAALEALATLGIEAAEETEEPAAALAITENNEEADGAFRLYDAPRQVL